jgi:hypothetical protein
MIKTVTIPLIAAVLLAVGCARRPPAAPPPPERTVPDEQRAAVQQARERSLKRLKGYRVGFTTRQMFVADGWRPSPLTEPLGDIGIESFHAGLNATNWGLASVELKLDYLDFPGTRVPVCSLRFGDDGKLETILWSEVVTNRPVLPLK